MEECGELIQACSKMIRFGITPDKIEQLEKEIGDVECLIDILQKSDVVSYTSIEEAMASKYEKLKEFSNLFPE
jgi:NTP pyrophosphatase (non-canonical NTP hydrolase)